MTNSFLIKYDKLIPNQVWQSFLNRVTKLLLTRLLFFVCFLLLRVQVISSSASSDSLTSSPFRAAAGRGWWLGLRRRRSSFKQVHRVVQRHSLCLWRWVFLFSLQGSPFLLTNPTSLSLSLCCRRYFIVDLLAYVGHHRAVMADSIGGEILTWASEGTISCVTAANDGLARWSEISEGLERRWGWF